jgi:uncharacterized protein
LQAALAGHDAVFSSTRFSDTPTDRILEATRAAGVRRLLFVGGAASLKVASGARMLDTPDFPAAYRVEATAAAAYLDVLKKEQTVEWTFLSPPALIFEGPRLGRYRLGLDHLLVDDQGRSAISFADYAIAYLDELENPRHPRQRFTVAY